MPFIAIMHSRASFDGQCIPGTMMAKCFRIGSVHFGKISQGEFDRAYSVYYSVDIVRYEYRRALEIQSVFVAVLVYWRITVRFSGYLKCGWLD